MLRNRPFATAALWLASALCCQLVSFAVAYVRMPDAPTWLRVGIGLFVTPIMALLIARVSSSVEDDLHAARTLPTSDQIRMLLAPAPDPPLDLRDGYARAALAIAAGRLDLAQHRLSLETRFERLEHRRHPAVVRLHLSLAQRGAAAAEPALTELAALPPMPTTETKRYRAYVTALAALLAPEPAAATAAETLGRERDADVQAYAAWIRAHLDLPLAEGEREAAARRGAELARTRGHAGLAEALDRRAAALAAAKTGSPYRGDARRVG